MQKIEIDHHITEIMALPCVVACQKDYDGSDIFYLVRPDERSGQLISVRPGDHLVEDDHGRWHPVRQLGRP